MGINQDSVAERTPSIIDPEPLIHNYCILTTHGSVFYEEVNGSASHVRQNICHNVCVCVNNEASPVTCGNMIIFMAFSSPVLTILRIIRFEQFWWISPHMINWRLTWDYSSDRVLDESFFLQDGGWESSACVLVREGMMCLSNSFFRWWFTF